VLVLLTEAEPGDAIPAALALGAAGHSLRYCHPPDDSDAVCGAVADGGRCPLLHDEVDVVVDVRNRRAPFTQREQGAICAVQHGSPLVVCGPVAGRPEILKRADARCDSVADLPQACLDATASTSPTARRAIAAAVGRVLQSGDRPPPLAVHLRPGRLAHDVVVTLQHEMPERERRLLQAAIRSALMTYTPLWRQVRVIVGIKGAPRPTAAAR
jgi:hypothetical protein